MEKETISVIGMGCRFPGGANNLETFWDLLVNNHSAISDIPTDRWNVEDYYSNDQEEAGKMYTKKGGFINVPVKTFDANFFSIPPKEACNLDPQQRLSLEVCYETIENAFINPGKLKKSNTGVFLGMSYDEFNVYKKNKVHNSNEHINAYSLTGSNFSCTAGRIAYTLGLEGPCMSIDTACSSSLVAVHQAKMSLLNGECDLAFAIGVNIILNPDLHIAFCKLKALSADGLCKTFDAKADGYVRSEGCGVILLKRTSDAIKDNNRIHAIIKGTSVNQDGTSDSFTAPSQIAQEKNLLKAYEDAEISLESVNYIEAHGTGTPLGDAVELNAIANVIGKHRTKNKQPLYVGSVKTNIGHLEPAAGIAGLIKVILSMENGILPANLNFSQPNPGINWKNVNIAVPTKNIIWSKEYPIVSGINSFGFSGTNVHIVIESYDTNSKPTIEINEYNTSLNEKESILCISAKSINSLNDIINKYIDFINKNKHLELSEICKTVYHGRAHYEYRLAAVGKTHNEIIDSMLQQQSNIFNSKQSSLNIKQKPSVIFLGYGDKYKVGNLIKELVKTNRVFKQAMIECDDIIKKQWKWSVLPDCIVQKPDNLTNCNFLFHLFVFAIEYSLFKTLESLGLNINIVISKNLATEYAFCCFKTKCLIKDTLSKLEKEIKVEDCHNIYKSFETNIISKDDENSSTLSMNFNKKTLVKVNVFSNNDDLINYIKKQNLSTYHLVDVEFSLNTKIALKELTNVENLISLGNEISLSDFYIKMYQCGGDLDSLYNKDDIYKYINIPTYVFDRKEFWIKFEANTIKPSLSRNYDPLNTYSPLDTNNTEIDHLENVFKEQIDYLVNQITDCATNQLDVIKTKLVRNKSKQHISIDRKIEVWNPFGENNTNEWKVICANSDVPFHFPVTTKKIINIILSDNIPLKPSYKTRSNEIPIHRMAIVCKSIDDARHIINDNSKKNILLPKRSKSNSVITAFMFTGLGEQYEKMGIGLYQKIPSFRRDLDYCFDYIKSNLGFDLKKILFSENGVAKKQPTNRFDLRAMLGREGLSTNADINSINRTLYAHTSILIIQYALCKLIMSYGIKPEYLIGHSLGEYSAACIADVMSIEEAIYLVVKRAEIIEKLVLEGRMLAVSLSSENMKSLLKEMKMKDKVSISLINSPQSVVVSGSIEFISIIEKMLEDKEILYRQLRSLRGFHSHMLNPIRKNLRELFVNVKFSNNSIPYISNVTGEWITKDQCTDPEYWVNHTCRTVEFEKGVGTLFNKSLTHLIEIGPGNSLCSFIAQNPVTTSKPFLSVMPTMRSVYGNDDDDYFFKKLLAQLWVDGANIFNINNKI